MATYDSTVRLRQLNQPELSGYIVQVIGDIPNTGNLTGEFYPLNSNPNGYVTTGQTGNFITQISLDSNYTNTLVYVGSNYYPLNSNPSGYVSSLNSFLVYSTGNQNVSGIKNFSSRPLIDGSPILSSGEIYSGVVLLTGDQTISGEKSFDSQVYFNDAFFGVNQNFVVNKEYIELFDPVSEITVLDWEQGSRFILSSSDGLAKINLYGKIIQNFNNISSENISGINIYKSGYSVISENELTGVSGIKIEKSGNYLLIGANSSNQNLQNVVYTYGNQNISGNKKFLDEVIIADTLDALNLFVVKGQGVFIRDVSDDFYPLYFDNGVEFNLNGKDDTSIKFYDKLITGFDNISATNIYRSGSPVVSFNQLSGGSGIKIQKNNDIIEISTSGIPDFQNVVYTTGIQTINGVKTFSNQIIIPSLSIPYLFPTLTASPDAVTIRDHTLNKNIFTFDEVDQKFNILGKDDAVIKFYDKLITGFDKISAKDIEVTGSLYVNGNNIENVVYTTGEQALLNKKNFLGGIDSLYFSAYSGIVYINDPYLNILPLNFKTGNYFNLSGNSGAKIELYNYSLITGFSGISSQNIYGSNIRVDGNKVVTGAQNTGIGSGIFKEKIDDKLIFRTLKGGIGNEVRIDSNGTLIVDFTGLYEGQVNVTQVVEDAVYTTGDQTIVGTKTFNKNIIANAIGSGAGVGVTNSNNSLFFGKDAGRSAEVCNNSIFIGREAGYTTESVYNGIFIGTEAGKEDSLQNNSISGSSILIGSYTSTLGYPNSICIGQGTANSASRQLNIGNVLYATNIRTGVAPSIYPMFNSGRVGILHANPQYTLDVNGDCRIFGDLWVDDPMDPNDPYNIQDEIGTINAWIEYWETYWKNWTVSELKVNNKSLSGAITLSGAGSVSVFTGNASTIIISGTPGNGGPGGGSINGATNLTYEGIYARTDGDILRFKGLKSGAGINISSYSDYLLIDTNPLTTVTNATNIGSDTRSPVGIFAGKGQGVGNDGVPTDILKFRKLRSKLGGGITLEYAEGTDVIEIGGGGSSSSLDCSDVSGCIQTGTASGAVINNIKNFFQDQNNYQFINNYTNYISGTISCDVISGCISTGSASGAVVTIISGVSGQLISGMLNELDCSFVSGCLSPSVVVNNPPSPPKINPIRPLFPGNSKGTPESVFNITWPFFATLNKVVPFEQENVPIIVENFNLLPTEVQQDIINEHQMVGEELPQTIERIILSNQMPMVTLSDNTKMSGFYVPVLDLNSSGFELGFTGSGDAKIKFFGDKIITGFSGIHADNIYQSGYKVLTTQDFIPENIVDTTSNQEIYGNKTFINGISINRTVDYGGGSEYGPVSVLAIDITGDSFDLYGEGQTAIKFIDKLITGFQGIQGTDLVSNKVITNRIHNDSLNNFSSSNYVGVEAGLQNPDYSPTHAKSNFIGFNAGKLQGGGDNQQSNIIGFETAYQASDFSFSNFIGGLAGKESSLCSYSNFIGQEAGKNANSLFNCNFIGNEAGKESEGYALNDDINFIGTSAGKTSLFCIASNFIGSYAGNNSYNSTNSNFIGFYAGAGPDLSLNQNPYSNFIGNYAGYNSSSSSKSNFIGDQAGQNAISASNTIFIGTQAGKNNNLNNDVNDFSILIGNYTSGKKNSIAIGQGAANSSERQLNIGNIIYATGLNTGIIPSSTPISGGKVGILVNNPQYTLDVSGTCGISGQTFFGTRPTLSGSGFLLSGELSFISGKSGQSIYSGNVGNNYHFRNISGGSGIRITNLNDSVLLLEVTGISSSSSQSTNQNVLTEKNGYGAGIYTFSKSLNQNISGNIFGVFNKSGFACQIFDVMINSSYSVAKKYSVVHQHAQAPISYLNVNSGPSGSQDFDVTFFNSGNSGVAMNIGNSGTMPSNFLVTLFLGGSPSGVEVREY